MLNSGFVQTIADIAVQGAHAHTAILPNDARKVVLTSPKGEVQIVDTPVPLCGEMDRVESVFRWAEKYKDQTSAGLFLSPTALTLVPDVADRRERIFCSFAKTAHCARLSKVEPMGQEDFINMLRLEFAERVDSNVIEKVKAIRFRKEESGEATVGHQAANATIGRSVQIEAIAGGTIPDMIPVRVQTFKNFDFDVDVTCAVVIDLEKRKFSIAPIAEELDELFMATMDAISSLRTDVHPPLFFGSVNS